MKRLVLFVCLVTSLGLGVPVAMAQAPRIFFTDLTGGPNSGGENGNGVYVTLYGDNFGATQASSTVALNGSTSALRVVSWGAAWQWYQKIVVQLTTTASSGNFVVTTSGGPSNPVPFAVRPGNIYCISTSGNDNNIGTFAGGCWRNLTKIQGGTGAASAGDVVYALNGVSVGPGTGWYSDSLTIGKTGTTSAPIALVAYPGATVTVGTVTGDDRGIFLCNNLSGCPNAGGTYWTIAGLTIRSVCEVVQVGVDGLRLVANDISAPNCVGGQSGDVMLGPSAHSRIYGNVIHDTAANTVPSVTKLHHAMYIGDGTNDTDIGWNLIRNNHGNRSIQVYTSNPNTSWGDIYDTHVHDNVIHDSRGDGILFNQVNTDKGTIEAYNNIVYKAGQGPDFPDGPTGWDCMFLSSVGAAPIQVYNNTLYNCGYSGGGQPGGGIYENYSAVNLRNNIGYQVSPFVYFYGGANLTCSNNLFYGAGSAPSNCTTGAVNSNPLFVNIGNFDFHLSSGSPAIDAGTNITSLLADQDGVTRPQGSRYDIGAYEFFSGTVRPNPPTNLTITVH